MPNNDEKKVLLKVTDLKQWFPLKKTKLFQKEQEYVRANDGITLNIYEGETVGLVGESGCGKSTFGRTLLQIYKQTEGKNNVLRQNSYRYGTALCRRNNQKYFFW